MKMWEPIFSINIVFDELLKIYAIIIIDFSFISVTFVKNYTEGRLSRYRQSSLVTTPTECITESDTTVCIHEVTSQTFEEIVMDNNKVIIQLEE